jgi:hypothetical protein
LVWSAYNHLIEQKNKVAFAPDGSIRTLEEMLENRIAAELDNVMVRYFCGIDGRDLPVGAIDRDVYDLAILHLEQAFPFVGMQERLGEAYQYLRHRFRWTCDTPLQLVNAGSYSSGGPRTGEDETLMRHFNKWDIMLYEHVCRGAQAL